MITAPDTFSAIIGKVLDAHDIEPVLVDIGASGATPEIWRAIANKSRYIGFDPDARDLHEVSNGPFRKAVIVNEAVTAESNKDTVRFYLTRSPHCSSTLKPDEEGLARYIFSDLFVVEREVEVRATTLNEVINRLQLRGVDWLKLDSQGLDLRLYQSLDDRWRKRLLAIDVEPGLIDAYRDEDLFVTTHAALVRDGFWLSDACVKGTGRMSRTLLARIAELRPGFDQDRFVNSMKPAPGWCEARYLRSLESLAQIGANEQDYALLWAFSLVDNHVGFALEVGLEFERKFSRSAQPGLLVSATLPFIPTKLPESIIDRKRPSVTSTRIKAILPGPIKRGLKRLLR